MSEATEGCASPHAAPEPRPQLPGLHLACGSHTSSQTAKQSSKGGGERHWGLRLNADVRNTRLHVTEHKQISNSLLYFIRAGSNNCSL